MTITTGAGLRAAMRAGQVLSYIKTGVISTQALKWATIFDRTGIPTGTIAGSSTTAGVVPTDATAGFSAIDSFNGSPGCIAKVEATSSNAIGGSVRLSIYDLLWKSGAHAFNAADTITAPPSYSSRIPSGSQYEGLEIWVEVVTVFTGLPDITVTYTNELGVAGRTTGVFNPVASSSPANMMGQMPLQAGDRGVQKIESVTCVTATVGTFNVLVMRPLVRNIRLRGPDTATLGPDLTGCPQLFDDSAIYPIVAVDNGSTTPAVDLQITLAVG